jgi:lysozyme
MRTKLLDLLIKHEGKRSKAYQDSEGIWTIGVGRNINPENGLGLSDDEIYYLLGNDIKRVEQECRDAFEFYDDLNEVRKDALLNLCFNLGLPRLRKFTLALGHLEAGRYDKSAEEFLDSLWATQVGQRAIEVAEMVKTGEYPI